MTDDISVSVIVPVYNVEIYIRQCVDSLLNQTFQDFEIILVDDASPDSSVEICKKFYGNNEKIHLVRHEKNRGLGAARNTGIKRARGKYICFVDSDDFILPETLETLFKVAEETQAEVVQPSGYFVLTQDEPEPVLAENLNLAWNEYTQEGFLVNNPFQRLEEHWKNNATPVMAWLRFCRRDFLKKNNVEFLEIISEDETFSFALLFLAERYYILRDAFYVYRQRKGSIMKNYSLDRFFKGIQAIVIGSAYIGNYLDRLPKVEGYCLWREGIMNEFFYRFINSHVAIYYGNLNVISERDALLSKTLTPFFGEYEPFVRFIFDGFNVYRRKVEIFSQQNNRLSAQVMNLINRTKLVADKIVFVNFVGRGYGCNPKYIAEEILRQNLPFDMVWLVNDMNEPMPEKIRKVSYGSVDSVYELATAKVIVSNTKNLLPFPGKKDGQFFIMTWHGGPALKHVEKDIENKLSASYLSESKANSKLIDLMLTNCQEQFDEFKRAFWYDGEILKCGLPRNDIFFKRDEKLIARVRKNLKVPPFSKVIMYAPTFRDNIDAMIETCRLDAKKLLDVLEKKFGDEWTLLMRFHPNVAEFFAGENFDSENIINATRYPDMQELILISDALISDYSSVIYDFMISDKPIFIYAKDFDAYTKERDLKQLYFDMPYKINRSETELFNCIETFDAVTLEPKIKNFIETVKPFDDGHASEKVVEIIKAVIGRTAQYIPPHIK